MKCYSGDVDNVLVSHDRFELEYLFCKYAPFAAQNCISNWSDLTFSGNVHWVNFPVHSFH
jgi:hypothetical protein